MNKPNDIREIATEFIYSETARKEKLIYIGAGTTCLVYKTETGDVIKEFCPLLRGTAVVMTRKRGNNDKLTLLEGLSEFDKEIVLERRTAFDSEIAIIEELNSRYRDDKDNMFLIPKDMPETSLGKCHWCNYIGGDTLETVFRHSRENSASFQEHFLNVLPLIISLYEEISFYHRDCLKDDCVGGIINLDVKPENSFAIRSQGKYIGIRNLDFGSAKRLDDKTNSDGTVEKGLVTLIKEFATKNSAAHIELLIEQIGSKFFASSPGFYDNVRIYGIIKNCLDPKKSNEDIILDLKLLDILAAWKTFLYAFCSTELFLEVNNRESENEKVYRIFADVFEKNHLTRNNSLFESYNIYCQLYEIMARSFKGKRRFRLTAAQIAARLRNILCILKNTPETDEEKYFEAMNHIFSQKDELLASRGLKSIKDILDFCQKNGLKKSESLGSLHWYLVFGTKHT